MIPSKLWEKIKSSNQTINDISDLQKLDMVNCTEITDLTPLRNLTNLQFSSLGNCIIYRTST